MEKEHNLKTRDILPTFREITKNENKEWNSCLPLELFDDELFDCRTPEEWLNLGFENNVRKPIPSLCLLPIDDDQHECKYQCI